MYLHKAPHRPWWPSPEKFAEFYEKNFRSLKLCSMTTRVGGSAAKSAEMNILTHMQYMHDSKIRPSTLEEMGEVNPEIVYYRIDGTEYRPGPGGFLVPFNRGTPDQIAKYNVTLDKINNDFKENWPKMNDKEKCSGNFKDICKII